MGRIHRFLGLTIGTVLPEVDDPELKRQAYAADITYARTTSSVHYLRQHGRVGGRADTTRPLLRHRRRGRLVLIDSADAADHLRRADDAQQLYSSSPAS
jgi:hypothetical protein